MALTGQPHAGLVVRVIEFIEQVVAALTSPRHLAYLASSITDDLKLSY